jgi:hypothetical protein
MWSILSALLTPDEVEHTGGIGHSMCKITIVPWGEDEFTSKLSELAGVGEGHFGDCILNISSS